MFVDSDDYVHEDFCRLPYECAVLNQVDLVMFRSQHIGKTKSFTNWETKKDNKTTSTLLNTGYKTHKEALDLLLTGEGIYWSTWNKLYKKELFDEIKYPIGLLYEDIGTTHKLVLKAARIYYLDTCLYCHCYREFSITTSKTEKVLRDWFAMSMQQYCDLAAWGYPPDKLEPLVNNTALTYLIQKKPNADDANYVFSRNALQSAKKIPEDFTWRRKVLFLLLKYCPPLFNLICEMWGKRWKLV